MKLLTTFTVFFALANLAFCVGLNSPADISHRRQYKTGQYYNDQYYKRYYKNPEIYNRYNYYDDFFKKYNPNIDHQRAGIVKQNVEPIREDGSYGYFYETENGIHNEAYGTATILDNGDKSQRVEGAFSYVTPEGIRVAVRYVADENGYRPIITYDGINVKQFTSSQPPASTKIARNN